ncbi:uncharacterized protein N7506_008778 [Penicillium brevicompactum]|uniref:uncharacterized protein n=1 Tax=Penicillium brevicompactum TaxID=5074 RepID=UPI00254256F5|nr:uncharacterized protein N7506_008778 [Penicillium brevicompactum]KAJ5325676.1 hypothetical protein N7506_008778 [Penicillium brevicompactum]
MTVNGSCSPKFDRIRDLVQERLDLGEELGLSLCVNIDGENVLDIWGGHANEEKSRPWEEDTLTVVWSSSKVITSLAALKLIDSGLLDPEESVSKYWPEFGANGKEDVKVWHFLTHSSGLPSWTEPITIDLLYDTPASTEMLARQAPWFTPGSATGYQMLNHGHLIGELVRRVSGKPLKQFIAEDIAGPLDADFSLGVAEEKWARTADVVPPPPFDVPEGIDMDSIMIKTFLNPAPDAKASMTPEFRAAEIGATNGFANARSLARIASIVSLGGTVDGKQHLSPQTIEQIFQERISSVDLVLGLKIRMGLGFGIPVPETISYIPEGNIVFWCGWGGSMVIMDLDHRMTITYAMNKMGPGLVGNANSEIYIKAIYEIMAQE